MKYYHFFLFLLLVNSFTIHSQQDTIDYDQTKSTISEGAVFISSLDPIFLYRGYEHKLSVGCSDQCDFPLVTFCANCDTMYLASDGSLTVIPGKSKDLLIYVYNSADTSKRELIAEKRYNVANLPDPTLYIGGIKNSGNIYYRQTAMFAKYPPEIWMYAIFDILDWEVKIGRKKYQGEGNHLSQEVLDHIKKLRTGKKIEIKTRVIGPDKLMRTINSEFYRCPDEWYENNSDIPLVDEYGNEL